MSSLVCSASPKFYAQQLKPEMSSLQRLLLLRRLLLLVRFDRRCCFLSGVCYFWFRFDRKCCFVRFDTALQCAAPASSRSGSATSSSSEFWPLLRSSLSRSTSQFRASFFFFFFLGISHWDFYLSMTMSDPGLEKQSGNWNL